MTFKHQRKKLDSPIKIKVNCTRLYPSKSVKYLGIKIDLNFAIFDSHIYYTNLIWGQNLNAVSRIVILKKKAFRIMNFQSGDSHSSPLFKSNHILKLEDKILISINMLPINHPTTFFLQSSKVGSPSALMFTIIKQSHLLLIKYLNHRISVSNKNFACTSQLIITTMIQEVKVLSTVAT